MDPLKEMFNKEYFEHLAKQIKKNHKSFSDKKFVADMLKDLSDLSLNQRLRKVSNTLHTYLPGDYKKNIIILKDTIATTPRGYVSLVFPDYVGLFGRKDFTTSLDALKYFTKFGSSEFAIREFLKIDFDKTLGVMKKWATDSDYHVRRLASEGSRPRLPWSFKLDAPIKNPFITKEILDQLNNDDELYVRKSVANHLNDISKDNPEAMIAIVKEWDKTSKNTSWIIKHGSRSLIKKGDKNTLSLFEFEKSPKIEVLNFVLSSKKIKLGDKLTFSFELKSKKTTEQNLVIDYAIHYKKSSGESSAKVFKLKEIKLEGNKHITISKQQLFKDFTTRKHHAGKHLVELLINGKPYGTQEFQLFV